MYHECFKDQLGNPLLRFVWTIPNKGKSFQQRPVTNEIISQPGSVIKKPQVNKVQSIQVGVDQYKWEEKATKRS